MCFSSRKKKLLCLFCVTDYTATNRKAGVRFLHAAASSKVLHVKSMMSQKSICSYAAQRKAICKQHVSAKYGLGAREYRKANTLRALRMRARVQDQAYTTALDRGQREVSLSACRPSDSSHRRVGLSKPLLRLKLGLLLLAMVDRGEALHPTPPGLTELSSPDGIQMLRNSSPTDQFWLLAQEFTTQDSQDWCGLASASMVLNALPIPKPALRAFEG